MNRNDVESIYKDLVNSLCDMPDNPIEALENSKAVAQDLGVAPKTIYKHIDDDKHLSKLFYGTNVFLWKAGDVMRNWLTWGSIAIEFFLVFSNLYWAIMFLPFLALLVLIDLIVDWRG